MANRGGGHGAIVSAVNRAAGEFARATARNQLCETQIIGWTAGVALFVNALGWVLDDIEVVRSLGNLQALLELAGDLSYGAFGLAIWWAIYNSWLRRPPTQEDPVLGAE